MGGSIIFIEVLGGVLFYNFNWSIGVIGIIIFVLLVGIYGLIVIDVNNCVLEWQYEIILVNIWEESLNVNEIILFFNFIV